MALEDFTQRQRRTQRRKESEQRMECLSLHSPLATDFSSLRSCGRCGNTAARLCVRLAELFSCSRLVRRRRFGARFEEGGREMVRDTVDLVLKIGEESLAA